MKNLFLFLFIFLLASSEVFAVGLKEAIEYGIENSEEVVLASEDAKLLKSTGGQIVAFTKPQLSLNAYVNSYGSSYSNKDSTSQIWPKKNMGSELNFSQALPLSPKFYFTLKIKEKYDKNSKVLYRMGLCSYKQSVVEAFNNVLFVKSHMTIEKDRFAQRKAELKDTQALFKAGLATRLDERQAKLVLNTAKNSLKQVETLYEDALIDFNRKIGRKTANGLWIPEGDLLKDFVSTALLEDLKQALEKDDLIDLKYLKSNEKVAEEQYKIDKYIYAPDFSIFGTYKKEEMTGLGEDIKDSWSAGITMNIPMFDGSLKKYKRAESRSKLVKAEKEFEKNKNDLEQKYISLKNNLETIDINLGVQKKIVSMASQNYKDARIKYKERAITLTELGDYNLAYAESRYTLTSLYYNQKTLINQIRALLDYPNDEY